MDSLSPAFRAAAIVASPVFRARVTIYVMQVVRAAATAYFRQPFRAVASAAPQRFVFQNSVVLFT